MDYFLNWLWQGAVVALAALITLRLIPRARAQARYVLCAIALLTVTALPLVSAWWAPMPPPSQVAQASGPGSPLLAVPSTWWTSSAVVFGAWALWCAAQAARMAGALLALRRARREACPLPPALESRLTCWNRVRGRGRRARLVVSPGVASAALLGGVSPWIALAPSILQQFGDDDLDRLVVHEWAHVQRRDDFLNLIQLAARAVFGWHPAVIALERQLRIEREAACDEIAVAVTGCPKRYAACLTAIAWLPTGSAPLASAPGALSSPALSSRVARILANGALVSPALSAAAAIVLVAAIATVSLAVSRFRPIGTAASVQVEAMSDTTPASAARADSTIPDRVPALAVDRKPAVARVSADKPRTTSRPLQPSPGTQGSPEPLAALMMPASIPSASQPGDGERLSSTPIHAMVGVVEVEPIGPALLDVAPATSLAETIPPWEAAADAGVAVGRGSQKAGVAVANFFSRFGRNVARSF